MKKLHRSKFNVVLVVFLDVPGSIHHEFVPGGQTLRSQSKLFDLLNNNSTIQLRYGIEVQLRPITQPIDQPQYLPDLFLCDYFYF